MAITILIGFLCGVLLHLGGSSTLGTSILFGLICWVIVEICFLHQMACEHFRKINNLNERQGALETDLLCTARATMEEVIDEWKREHEERK